MNVLAHAECGEGRPLVLLHTQLAGGHAGLDGLR